MSFRESLSTRVSRTQAAAILILVGLGGLLCVFLCGMAGFTGGLLSRSGPQPSPLTVEPAPSRQTTPAHTVEPTSSPTVVPTSTTPPTPAHGGVPPGEVAEVNEMGIVVEGTTRPADEIVLGANDLNVPPEPGSEYIFVHVSITCFRNQTDDPCIVSPLLNFKLIGSDVAYTPEILLFDVPGLLEGGEISGNTTVSGAMAFEISQNESDMLLMYETIIGSDRAFLAVP